MVFYASNAKAWMTKVLLRDWVEKILKPHAAKYERTLLLWDHFSAHRDKEIVERLYELNVDVLLVPPGMTFCLQPLDVYINRPFKDHLRLYWNSYIADPDSKLNTKGKIQTLRILTFK